MFPPEELRKFTESGRTIAAAVGTSVELWARAEAGVILKTWAGRTKVSALAQADRTAAVRALHNARRAVYGSIPGANKGSVRPGEASINLGFRGAEGRTYYRTRKAGLAGGRAGLQDVFSAGFGRGKHIAPGDWPRVSSLVNAFRIVLQAQVALGRRAIGLARQSVVQIADDLGIDLATVRGGGGLSAAGLAKARAAIATTGRHYQNGLGIQTRSPGRFVLELVNRYPQGVANGMDATLAGVIAGRIKYFERNLAEGTFLSAARAARAYPYLSVLKAAA